MPEQPQWPERTLDMPPQDPWADPPTTDMPPRRAPGNGPGQHPDPTRRYDATRAATPGRPPQYDATRVAPGHPPQPDATRAATPGRPPQPDATRAAPGRPPQYDATRAVPPGEDARASQPDPTRAVPPGQGAASPAPPPSPFSSGRAAVNPRPQPQQQFVAEHEPTGTGWPGAGAPSERRPLGWHLAQLRRGGEWSFAGLLFAFVCWGIWAISSDGDLTAPIVVFIVSVAVAGGVFALSRLVGRLVLERQLHRERRTAKGSHIVAGIFLVGVGIAHLRQTEWVMTAVNWVVDLFR
ncbi:hypothetical protein Asp14428_31170 [Actinoplanes sp. NBRC 14428]|nr:hypothetical protein Asp14428_31170 [Actinoplanes sp. NBRC 14428]